MVQDRVEVEIGDGEFVIEPIDSRVRNQGFETYRAACGDPGSASGEVVWEFALSRGDLARAHPNSNQARLGPGYFFIEAEQKAWENDTRVHHRTWHERITRDGL
jgi:hypothetical protein